MDFIKNNPCDILVQLLSTSPFLESEEINKFVREMKDGNYETYGRIKKNEKNGKREQYEQIWNVCKWIWMDIITYECMCINVNE